MKATVNKDLCIGCTLCVQRCPEVFAMEGDKTVVNVDIVPEEVEESCRQAADECPVIAVTISEEGMKT